MPDIKADVLPTHRIDACCDSASLRYALGAIELSRSETEGELYATATNGAVAAVVKFKGTLSDDTKTALMPPSMFVAKTKKEQKTHAVMNGQWTRGEKLSKIVEGRFPRVEDVFPVISKETHKVVGITGEQLRKLCDAIGSDEGSVVLFIEFDEDGICSSPMAVQGANGIGVLMPCNLKRYGGFQPLNPSHEDYASSVWKYQAAKQETSKRVTETTNATNT